MTTPSAVKYYILFMYRSGYPCEGPRLRVRTNEAFSTQLSASTVRTPVFKPSRRAEYPVGNIGSRAALCRNLPAAMLTASFARRCFREGSNLGGRTTVLLEGCGNKGRQVQAAAGGKPRRGLTPYQGAHRTFGYFRLA